MDWQVGKCWVVFFGALLVLNDGLWLMERLVLVLECLGHFW
jgi:hypothetical protein